MEKFLDHPVIRFAQDRTNFSINTDDPTITGTYMNYEYDLVRSWGLTEAHLIRAVRKIIIFLEFFVWIML